MFKDHNEIKYRDLLVLECVNDLTPPNPFVKDLNRGFGDGK